MLNMYWLLKTGLKIPQCWCQGHNGTKSYLLHLTDSPDHCAHICHLGKWLLIRAHEVTTFYQES